MDRYQNLEHAMTLIRNGAMVHSPLEKALVEEIDRLRKECQEKFDLGFRAAGGEIYPLTDSKD